MNNVIIKGTLLLFFMALLAQQSFNQDVLQSAASNAQSAAQMFAPGVVSTGDVFGTTFSPDGKTVYFCKSDEFRKDVKLMVSRLENGKWSEPVETEFSKLLRYNAQPFMTADGKALYYAGMNPKNAAETNNLDIFYVRRNGKTWSAPQSLGAPINTEMHEYFPTVSRKNTIYYASDRGPGGGDIWRARLRDGKIVEREMLAELNSTYAESNPYIAPDESFLIFLSDRPGGFGLWDLWITFHENGKWSAPVNLGAEVNTGMREFSPTISPDGKRLYFTRTLFENGKRIRPENIFSIELAGLAAFRGSK